MYPTLYEILVKARKLYDEEYSPYICDCITEVEDEFQVSLNGEMDFDYPVTRPILNFIKEDIREAYSVSAYLFPPKKHQYTLTPEQAEQVREYRENLWQRLFDFATEQEHDS